MSNNKKDTLKRIRTNQRSYLNRDFSSFRAQLVDYGRTFFSDQISDFSQNGLAGMFTEMVAYVGDNMSYYLDHQFTELDITQAVESKNIERLVRASGVKIQGASPSIVDIDFYLEIPSTIVRNEYVPDITKMPKILAGTIVQSNSGVSFTLYDDIDFTLTNANGSLKASYSTMKTDSSGNPTSFSIKQSGMCTSSTTAVEKFSIPDKFKPFRTITLSNPSVSEIISVEDTEGNSYYEVESLTQDTVFKKVLNTGYDKDEVAENLELISAPRRFITESSQITKKTKIRFGGGTAESTDDDIMPDPSDLSIPLYGRRETFSTFTIDPNKLLNTTTLGITPRNTTISVYYRSGGGISHNVAENTIRNVKTLLTKFSSSVSNGVVSSVRSSVEVNNKNRAAGGEAAPTLDELRTISLNYRNSQGRIVTKQDMIARIYTMPSSLGRVFRCGIRSNPYNPQSSMVSIISRDSDGNLILSSDALKNNLSKYINEYRLISDAIDIVDASVINLKITYSISTSGDSNPETVLQASNKSISEYFQIENFQIEQPVILTDIINIIINTPGVVSLITLNLDNIAGTVDERVYSDVSYSVRSNLQKGVLHAPPGGIFEVKFPDDDIIGIIS
ncbi:hypothetical protein CL614_06660 [archaeon]|nr:hypothetical protein [archaeon]